MVQDPFADPLQRPRYTGIPTLMRAPHTEDLGEADVALVGIPLDGGVTNRPGARHGPREIRNQSGLMRAFNPANRINPYELARVRDVGDALIRRPFRLEDSLDDIEAFFREVHAAGAVPISAGGDHSLTLPVFRAIAAERPVGMVHFDAHCDTGGPRWGTAVHHGAPFKAAVEEGLLDPTRTVQIGIRGATAEPDAWRFSYESGMRVITMDEFHRLGVEAVIAEARRVAGDGPTYVSFDVDGLDPVFAPGTGTPEVGGYTTLEAQLMLRGLRGLDLVGGDVVEVAPPFDPSGATALVGATMMYEILCIVADAFAARRRAG